MNKARCEMFKFAKSLDDLLGIVTNPELCLHVVSCVGLLTHK